MSLYIRNIGGSGSSGAQCKSGTFYLTANVEKRFECGFRPKGIMILIGIASGINNVNVRAGIYIDENGLWSDLHTSTTGASSYANKVPNRALNTDFTIDDTGFTLKCSSGSWASSSKEWAFIAIGEPISEV